MKKFFSNTALLSALLIFVGYLNLYIYYNEFSINISSYLTTGELLLSFLPLTIPLLVLASFFFFPLLQVLTTSQSRGKESASTRGLLYERIKHKEYVRIAIRNLRAVIRIIRQRRVKKKLMLLIFTILEIIRFVFGIMYHVFFFCFILVFIISVFSSNYQIAAPIGVWILFTVFWYLFFEDETKKEDRDPEMLSSLSAIVAGVLFLGLVSIHNKTKASSVLRGEQDFKVGFLYDTLAVKTDTNLVYIGKTNQYLFLRDRKARSNKIFELNRVTSLEFTETIDEKK